MPYRSSRSAARASARQRSSRGSSTIRSRSQCSCRRLPSWKWIAANPGAERYLATLADVRVGRVFDLTTLPVAVREARNLIEAPADGG